MYKNIFAEYMAGVKDGKPKMKLIQELAIKHKYCEGNIRKIIASAQGKPWSKKANSQRLTKAEVVKRDKEIYIAYLQWPGTRIEFAEWAAEKYAIDYDYVGKILRYHFAADPKRYEQSYHPKVMTRRE